MNLLWLVPFGAAGCGIAAGRTLLAIRRDGDSSHAGNAEAVAIFGARVRDGSPSSALKVRIDHGARLYFERRWSPLVCCGTADELKAMRQLLLERGVASVDIALCTAASTRSTVGALADGDWRGSEIAAVSSRYHMHRILREGRRHGVAMAPMPCAPAAESAGSSARVPYDLRLVLRGYLREVAANWWYALTWRMPRSESRKVDRGTGRP